MAAPITLSPQQFRKTEAFKHGGDYRTYLHFLAVHRGRLGTGPPVVDPLAPNPNIAQDAAAAVRAQTAPVIANIQADYARQQKAGASAIAAGGKSLMDAFAQYAPAEKQAYDQAAGQMTSLNTALANRLTGQGTALQGELAQKLAAINAPGAQQQAVAVGTGAIGAGAANAGFASGAANISDLIARGAAARDYGAKLPGIAARIGATNLRNLAAQTESDRAKAVGAVRAQIPGMVTSQLGQLRTEELNKAFAQLGLVKAQQAETAQTQRTQAQIDAANARAAAANDAKVTAASAKATATAAKTDAQKQKSRQSAVVSASKSVVPLFTKGSTIKTVDQYSGNPINVRVKIGSPAYNRLIHQAAAAVSDALSPYMTPQQILGWVQQKAKPFFAPAKSAGAKPHPDVGFRGADLGNP